MEIKPIDKIIKDGEELIATKIELKIVDDNLESQVTFYYELLAPREQEDPEGNIHTVFIPVNSGNITIDNGEYDNWDNSNTRAYEMVCQELGIELKNT